MSENIKDIKGKPIPPKTIKHLEELRNLEIALGYLPPETWAISDLHRRVNDPQFPLHANQMEQKTELLFGEICEDLHAISLSHSEIAEVVNSFLQYPSGPKYCDEQEVQESLLMDS